MELLKTMNALAANILIGLFITGLFGCASSAQRNEGVQSTPLGTVWTGGYRREDNAYDLFIEQVEPDIVEAAVVVIGKSPKNHDDVESFLLARIEGQRANRIPLPGHDCYLGLEKKVNGMAMIDGCGGQYSGFYKPFLAQSKDR